MPKTRSNDTVTAQAETLRSAASALEHGRYSTAIKKLNKAFGGLKHLVDNSDLPPLPQHDGEPTPTDKAQYALRALTQYALDTASGEMDNALSDFLADAMHLCHLGLLKDSAGNTQDFHNELERGGRHYDAEIAEANDK